MLGFNKCAKGNLLILNHLGHKRWTITVLGSLSGNGGFLLQKGYSWVIGRLNSPKLVTLVPVISRMFSKLVTFK